MNDAACVNYSVTEDGETDGDAHLTVDTVTSTLENIATHSRSLYRPYAQQVFEKACSTVEGVRGFKACLNNTFTLAVINHLQTSLQSNTLSQ